MDFSNERYVRLYVRDTTAWKLLKFEGQSVWTLLYRRADRSGVISLSGVEPWEAAVLHCDFPEEVAKVGMQRCLDRGWIVRDGDRLVFPKYIEANETPQSDAQRVREHRAREREARAKLKPPPVDVCNETLPRSNETLSNSNAEKRPVTSGNSVPYRAVPEEELRPPPTREGPSLFRIGHDLIRDAIGNQYGDEWRRQLERIGEKPDPERRAVVAAISCDPWCRANKTSVNPDHVLKHWAKYAAGNPPLKSVVRSRYAGPSRVPTAEEYAQDAKEKAPWEM